MKRTLLSLLGFGVMLGGATGSVYYQHKLHLDSYPARLITFAISFGFIVLGMFIVKKACINSEE